MRHPRLYFSADGIDGLRSACGAGVAAWLYRKLLASCEAHLRDLDPDGAGWDHIEGIVHAHAVIRPLVELSLAWVISRDDRLALLARRILARICTWDTWYAGYEPTRALIISAACRALDWLDPALAAQEARTILDTIVAQTRLLYANSPAAFPPERSDSGPPRCYAPLGIAGLLLAEEIEEAAEWVRFGKDACRTWIERAYDEDGAPYYSSDSCYSTIAMSDLLSLVFALRHHGDEELARHPALARAALYPLYRMEPQRDGYGQFCVYNRGPLSLSHSIGLAALTRDGLAQWQFLAAQGPEGLAHRGGAWGGRNGRDDLAMGLLWYRDVEVERPDTSPRLSRGKLFRGSGKMVMRSGFEKTSEVYLAMECGPERQGWSQADCGSIVLDALGERFVDDPGVAAGIDWSGSAQAHNVVLLDGRGPSLRGSGRILGFLHTGFADCALADQSLAYGEEVVYAHRHVLYIRPGAFVIVDDVVARQGVQAAELLVHVDEHHLKLRQDSESRFTLPGSAADLRIAFAEPWSEPAVPGTRNASGVMYAEHRLHRQVADVDDKPLVGWYSFAPAARRMEQRERALFVTLLEPVARGADVPQAEILREQGAAGFRLGSVLCMYRTGSGELSLAGLRTDAALLLVDPTPGGGRLLASRCTRLEGDGIPGVAASEPVALSLDGSSARVAADAPVTVTFRRPGLKGLRVGGEGETAADASGCVELRLQAGQHDLSLR